MIRGSVQIWIPMGVNCRGRLLPWFSVYIFSRDMWVATVGNTVLDRPFSLNHRAFWYLHTFRTMIRLEWDLGFLNCALWDAEDRKRGDWDFSTAVHSRIHCLGRPGKPLAHWDSKFKWPCSDIIHSVSASSVPLMVLLQIPDPCFVLFLNGLLHEPKMQDTSKFV